MDVGDINKICFFLLFLVLSLSPSLCRPCTVYIVFCASSPLVNVTFVISNVLKSCSRSCTFEFLCLRCKQTKRIKKKQIRTTRSNNTRNTYTNTDYHQLMIIIRLKRINARNTKKKLVKPGNWSYTWTPQRTSAPLG